MISEDDAMPAGAIIDGRYQLDVLLNEGGMGLLYRAHHRDTGHPVAIKLLHTKLVPDQNVVRRFRQEALIASSLNHVNICQVFELGTSRHGAPYLVMPLLEGKSLAELLKTEQLGLQRLVNIFSQILDGLAAAHAAQVVHRDLKPENVFVSPNPDGSDTVRLLDFGISRILSNDSETRLTRTGTIIGTPAYMAPEQARGDKHTDFRIDIYALGVMLHEAVTGTLPFEGNSYNAIVYKILSSPVQPPSAVNPALPAAIEEVIITAMAREPGERYESATQMHTALISSYQRTVGAPTDDARSFETKSDPTSTLSFVTPLGNNAADQPESPDREAAHTHVSEWSREIAPPERQGEVDRPPAPTGRQTTSIEYFITPTLAYARLNRIYILVHGPIAPSMDDWTECVGLVRDMLESDGVDAILVSTPGQGPDAGQRKMLAAVMGQSRIKTAILTPSLVARSIMNALKWFTSNISAYYPDEMADAMEDLQIDKELRPEVRNCIRQLTTQLAH